METVPPWLSTPPRTKPQNQGDITVWLYRNVRIQWPRGPCSHTSRSVADDLASLTATPPDALPDRQGQPTHGTLARPMLT